MLDDIVTQVIVFSLNLGVFFLLLLLTMMFLFGLWSRRTQGALGQKPYLTWTSLNEEWTSVQQSLVNPSSLKAQIKHRRKSRKKHLDDLFRRPKIFTLSFKGDLRASQVDRLREEVSSIILMGNPDQDLVLIQIESHGGLVNSYGLCSSQIYRLKNHGFKTVASVDQIAASGGYLMACTAHQIIAAPFAFVGSIGVVSQMPNFNRVLKKNEVDFVELTAGESKRDVTLFGELTSDKISRRQNQLTTIHDHFKDHVLKHRPGLKDRNVFNGEYWLGQEALTLGLIDRIQTAADFQLQHKDTHHVIEIEYRKPKSLRDRLFSGDMDQSRSSLTVQPRMESSH